jgi:CheY-like chemotaxis protein
MKNINILALVDDDDTYVYITKKIIEKSEQVKEVRVFKNGLDAIDYLKQNINDTYELPDVIFLDLSMPIMDGWQFLDEFATMDSNNLKKIIIYICSSSISPHDFNRAKEISAVSDFIIKPITKVKFTEILMAIS